MTQVVKNDIKVIIPRDYREVDPVFPLKAGLRRKTSGMFDFGILFPSVLNGLTTGAVYALIALGPHADLRRAAHHQLRARRGLMLALYGVYFLKEKLGIDPYLALPIMVPACSRSATRCSAWSSTARATARTRTSCSPRWAAIVMENLALLFFKSDTRTIDTAYSLSTVAIGPAMIAVPKLVAFVGALVVSGILFWIMGRTDLGRAIRAVAKEKDGAKLMGIDVDHVYAMSFGIGLACLGAAACFLLPAYYVNPQVGGGFVLVAFTIVVLGGMGSFVGALIGGFLVGVVESLGGLYLGESLGQIGIFADLHRRRAVPAAGHVRGQGMKAE
jgi:branched-chain amino acid transport system permease protein